MTAIQLRKTCLKEDAGFLVIELLKLALVVHSFVKQMLSVSTTLYIGSLNLRR